MVTCPQCYASWSRIRVPHKPRCVNCRLEFEVDSETSEPERKGTVVATVKKKARSKAKKKVTERKVTKQKSSKTKPGAAAKAAPAKTVALSKKSHGTDFGDSAVGYAKSMIVKGGMTDAAMMAKLKQRYGKRGFTGEDSQRNTLSWCRWHLRKQGIKFTEPKLRKLPKKRSTK